MTLCWCKNEDLLAGQKNKHNCKASLFGTFNARMPLNCRGHEWEHYEAVKLYCAIFIGMYCRPEIQKWMLIKTHAASWVPCKNPKV